MNANTANGLKIGLGIFTAVSTIAGAALTGYETYKFTKAIDALKASKPEGEKPTKKEYALLALKYYALPASVVAIGVAGTVGSYILNDKIQTTMGATIVALDQGWRKYGNNVKKAIGWDKNKEIVANMAKEAFEEKKAEGKLLSPVNENNKELFWEEHLGHFYASELDIALMMLDVNECLGNYDSAMYINKHICITLEDIVSMGKLELLDPIPKGLDNFGWSPEQLIMEWDASFVHHEVSKDPNGYKILNFYEGMMYDPENYEVRNGIALEDIDDIRKHNMENAKRILLNTMKIHGATEEEMELAKNNKKLSEFAKKYNVFPSFDIEQEAEMAKLLEEELKYGFPMEFDEYPSMKSNYIRTGDPYKDIWEALEAGEVHE